MVAPFSTLLGKLRNRAISGASAPIKREKMSRKKSKGGGGPPRGPPTPPDPGRNGGRSSSGPPPRSETNEAKGGKRKRRSPTGETPEGKADRRDSPVNAAAASDTAGPSSGSGVPRPAAGGSGASPSQGGVLPSPGGSPSASEPGWVPPGLWDPSGRRPRETSLSASPSRDPASRLAPAATRPVQPDHKTAVRPETRPSPGRASPSSPHPRPGALRVAGELGSLDPRARGVNDPLPDPSTGASPSSARPPHGALGPAGAREAEVTDREMREYALSVFANPSSDPWTKVTGSKKGKGKGKGKSSGRPQAGSCRPQATSSPRRMVGPRVSELEPPPSSAPTATYGPLTPAVRPGPEPSTSSDSQEVVFLSPEGSDHRPIKKEVDSSIDLGSVDGDDAEDLEEAEIARLLDDSANRMDADDEDEDGMPALGDDVLRQVEAIQLQEMSGVDGDQPPPKRQATYAAVASAAGSAPLRAHGVLTIHSGWETRRPLSRNFFDAFISRISQLGLGGAHDGGVLNDVLWTTFTDGRGLIAVNSEEALHRIQRWINNHPDNATRGYRAWRRDEFHPGHLVTCHLPGPLRAWEFSRATLMAEIMRRNSLPGRITSLSLTVNKKRTGKILRFFADKTLKEELFRRNAQNNGQGVPLRASWWMIRCVPARERRSPSDEANPTPGGSGTNQASGSGGQTQAKDPRKGGSGANQKRPPKGPSA